MPRATSSHSPEALRAEESPHDSLNTSGGPSGLPDFSSSSQTTRRGLADRPPVPRHPAGGQIVADVRLLEEAMKLKLLAILVLVVAGAGAIFVSVGGLPTSAAANATYLTSVAVVGNISDDIAATGTIAASTSYGLTFGSAAQQLTTASATTAATTGSSTTASSTTWPVSSVAVKVGDPVKKGAALATRQISGRSSRQRRQRDAPRSSSSCSPARSSVLPNRPPTPIRSGRPRSPSIRPRRSLPRRGPPRTTSRTRSRGPPWSRRSTAS